MNMMVMCCMRDLSVNNAEKPIMDSSVGLMVDNEVMMDYKMGFEENNLAKHYTMG